MKTVKVLFEYAASVWMLLFIAFFLGSIVLGIVQAVRRKDLSDTRVMPVVAMLWLAWTLPIALLVWLFGKLLTLPLYLVMYLVFGAICLWHRAFGKPKPPKQAAQQ